MLGSITPLGERGRGSRWWVTVSAYLAGSLVGGAVAGGLLAALGLALGASGWSTSVRLAAIAIALVFGLVLDLGVGGLRLPTIRRQVDEGWRGSYRGWVWGLTFGFQLALGVVTVVTTSTVYMGLVHTRMSEPTPRLNKMPGLTPEQAADQVCTAVAERPHNITPPMVRPADALGNLLRVPTDRLLEQYFRRTGGGIKRGKP